ncbi:aminoglycoside adenylyltransferase domain-containing protein [Haloimpatiens massiliensis]|uniref:aminoglycoside adenylyltransferase domain-containing protein n=1 Tax=Haloimpatiens massiliensis TaxID=1658110 RepID=UPI000C84C7C8|nr:aminoglycoside adenylyltransferase domain-containing protein [Haloimpatiens massiliensis]
MKSVENILDSIIESYHDILQDNLIGIYIHGSLAMNCFNPDVSDIDLLVVIKERINFNTKRQLIDILLKLSKKGPHKGLEMSILLEDDVKHFRYPTPFILHYSNVHKEKYENDYSYMCEDGQDPDLAAHITVTIARGICIFGKSIKDVFEPVPPKYYFKSILYDVDNAKSQILNLPVYTILNLCRVLYYLKEGAICSKKEGGEWVYSNVSLQKEYVDIIKEALSSYENTTKFNYNPQSLVDFADFMLEKIYLNYNLE